MAHIEVPTIDVSAYLNGDASEKESVARSLDQACREIGFLIITGHEISPEVIEKTRLVARQFFGLSSETKTRCKNPPRGYRALGSTAFSYSRGVKTPPDIREAYSMGPCDFPDDDYHRNSKGHFTPNPWPDEVPSMKDAFCNYFRVMEELGRKMMRLCALALKLPESFFDKKFDRASDSLVVNYYPRQTVKPVEGQLRGGAHTDYGAITLLQRDNTPGGLQVRTKDDQWIDLPYVENSFVLNIGDMLSQWTNDHWRSTLHQVVNPPWDTSRNTDRISMAFFYDPNYETQILPLETCCSPNDPPKYELMTAGEHKMMKMKKMQSVNAQTNE